MEELESNNLEVFLCTTYANVRTTDLGYSDSQLQLWYLFNEGEDISPNKALEYLEKMVIL